MTDQERVMVALLAAGVRTADYGRFVNNTKYFRPSNFDVRAATPVLLEILPSLTDRQAAMTVVMYLQYPTVGPESFDVLRNAFVAWAPKDASGVGWQLGVAVVRAAKPDHLTVLLDLAQRREFGRARQMIVDSLWRFRKDRSVAPILAQLCEDPDVCLHAMSAYRRTVGNETAIKLLSALESHGEPNVQAQAKRACAKAAKAMRSKQ
jgi:hypothetical protein